MTRQEIVEIVAADAGLTRAQADQAVREVITQLVAGVKKDGQVIIRRFGSFSLRYKNGRDARNPRTGEYAYINPRRVVVFKASNGLKAQVDS